MTQSDGPRNQAARGLKLEFCKKLISDPRSRRKHSCHHQRACGIDARGSPEARGTCRDDRCLMLSEKTHVFDVANRPWLLPYLAKRAAGAVATGAVTARVLPVLGRDGSPPELVQGRAVHDEL